MTKENDGLFNKLKRQLLNIDPVYFCQEFLTLDGKPFTLNGNGYRPFADIYRHVGIKSLEPTGKPVIIVKGRQIGASTMASALEMYFMGSGLFGTEGNPPIRVIHAFPQLELAAAFSKTKLNQMIISSIPADNQEKKNSGKLKSHMQALLDQSTATNDSLHFKQFMGGNHLWIESTGLDSDRLMGRTADVIFFDECYPSNQNILTIDGKIELGKLYELFKNNETLPLVKTFNESTYHFEHKKILNVWCRGKKNVITINCNNHKLECTPNHQHLTNRGWVRADELKPNDLLKSFPYLFETVKSIENNNEVKEVYDIEVEGNHNFILTSNSDKNYGGPIVHNCQKISGQAIGNALKILTTAKYGKPSKGVQVYFGTPRRKGSDFHKMWEMSSQQYYHLGCEKCNNHFPLYTPGSDDWEKIWLYKYIVKCTHCGFEQDKLQAAERGKWVSLKKLDDEDCLMVGFHINQLYMPMFTKEDILSEKPGIHPINVERLYQNEVLGEFFQGDSSPISPEDIREKCGDTGRKFRGRITPSDNLIVTLGIDYGSKADLEQLANPDKARMAGQSYSTAVILSSKAPGLLSIEFATKFKRNDIESKKGLIDKLMRDYSVNLTIGDIGYSNDFSTLMHTAHGDKYIVSRAHNKVNDHVKFSADAYPKEIVFERDYYISELYDQMKKGQIRFPFGDYEKIAWLIEHCASMEIKPSISRVGEPTIHYVKGSTQNDGLMALLNAYIAYKFIITKGFSSNNPNIITQNVKDMNKPLVLKGFIPRKF